MAAISARMRLGDSGFCAVTPFHSPGQELAFTQQCGVRSRLVNKLSTVEALYMELGSGDIRYSPETSGEDAVSQYLFAPRRAFYGDIGNACSGAAD